MVARSQAAPGVMESKSTLPSTQWKQTSYVFLLGWPGLELGQPQKALDE